MSNAYELLGPGPLANTEKTATALIDVGASKSNIAIVQGTRLLFTREVYLAGNEITDAIVRTFNEPAEDIERIKAVPGDAVEALMDAAMPAFEDLANEIRLSFDYVEGQFDAQVTTVVLTGGSSQLPGIAGILGNILGRPVQVLDPLAGLDLIPSKYDIHGLDANSPTLTVALGLAAHILQFSQSGLGGANSHGWQPRQGRDGSARTAGTDKGIMPVPGNAPAPTPVAVMAAAPAAFSAPPAPAPLAFNPPPPAPLAATPPPPAALRPEEISYTPPSVPSAMPVASALDLALPGDEPASGSNPTTDSYANHDSNRSGLLVVLDEDQEMPPSERHERGTISRNSPIVGSSLLRVEGFSEDDESDKEPSGGLPELPKL